MDSSIIFLIFAWFFFLICGGIMMLGVYLIFVRKPDHKERPRKSNSAQQHTAADIVTHSRVTDEEAKHT